MSAQSEQSRVIHHRSDQQEKAAVGIKTQGTHEYKRTKAHKHRQRHTDTQ